MNFDNMKITFKTYKLFYLLTTLLFLVGFITRNFDIVSMSEDTTFIIGFWSFFIPAGLSSLIISSTYYYFDKINRVINEKIIITHFVVMVIGLILLFITIVNHSYLIFNFYQIEYKLILISVPIILLLSIIVFIYGIIKSKNSKL
jgi:hypothetical protein